VPDWTFPEEDPELDDADGSMLDGERGKEDPS
jgi:hypothetical protein